MGKKDRTNGTQQRCEKNDSLAVRLSRKACRNLNLKRRRIHRHLPYLFSPPQSLALPLPPLASKQYMIFQRQLHFFMASLTGFAAVAAVYVLVFARFSTGKELRPSEHGLEFQDSPSAWLNYSSGMRSFFNSSQVSNSSDIMTMPKATNSSDSSPSAWWSSTDSGERSHVRQALVIASLVCGVTGVILLVATGLLLLSKHRKHKANEACGDNDNDKLQLAVRNEDP